MTTRISYCNYADLKAKILRIDRNKMRAIYNLSPVPSPGPHCQDCKKALHHKPKTGYCIYCLVKNNQVTLACAECNKLFQLPQGVVLYRLNTPQHSNNKPVQGFFCSAKCRSRYCGIHYGFAVHPENRIQNIGRGG